MSIQMEIFFIALAGNLEPCILDKNPYNYEVHLKITYDDFRLSVVKKKSVLDHTEHEKTEQQEEETKNVEKKEEEGITKMDSVKKEDGSKMFWSVEEEEMTCFENIVRQRLTDRHSDVVLGTHRITYFYSDSLMAMPDYLYDTSVPSFPLLLGIDVERILMIH